LGQAYRLTGNASQALLAYKAYLRNVPDAPNRAEVEGRIAELQARHAASFARADDANRRRPVIVAGRRRRCSSAGSRQIGAARRPNRRGGGAGCRRCGNRARRALQERGRGSLPSVVGALEPLRARCTLAQIFADPTNADYRPKQGSTVPCTLVDRGVNAGAPDHDLVGTPRPRPAGGTVDIGAYELP
jgi:hypothetical protein